MEPGVLFGLGSAAAFGSGDFAGGSAARRAPALPVAAGAQLVGLLLLLAALVVLRPGEPDIRSMGLGALAGAFGGLGLAALYRGLALGSMGLVTALSGVGSVAIPVLVGTALLGNTMGPLQGLGVAAAIGAGALASGARTSGVTRDGLRLAGMAALGFGLWFVLLDLAAAEPGQELWTLVASRASATVLIGAIALGRARRQPLGRAWRLVALAGALDVTGNALFVFSTSLVAVGVAAALSGLYPIVTMLLARALLRESLPPAGLLAVGLAVAGIVLISAG